MAKKLTIKEQIQFKQQLHKACCGLIEQRMAVAEKAMKDAQESANSEEKSSAGDKYETGRAMSQIDRDRNAKQLTEAKKELAQLARLELNGLRDTCGTGALVYSDGNCYFIAAAIGQIEFENQKIIVLSPKAPLAQEMGGKKAGDLFTFNGKQCAINSVL